MQKTNKTDYIKRYMLCLPILNCALFSLSVLPMTIRVWLDGGSLQLIALAGAAMAANVLVLKIMIVWMLPHGLHAKLIAAPKNTWVNALLLAMVSIVFAVLAVPVLQFYRTS